MPDGLQITPAAYHELPEVAATHVKSWKQAYAGQVPEAYLDNLDVAARLRAWQEQFPSREISGLLIARVDNTTAGFVCFGPARDNDRQDYGEIYAIYLRKEYWNRGIGYALYRSVCDALRDEGFQRAYLWVLETNHQAIAAYERWGGLIEHSRVKDHFIGTHPVKEVSVLFNFG
jgi:GNAT superfamily N-acetyltransferase